MTDKIVGSAWDRYYASLDVARSLIAQTPRFRDAPAHRPQAFVSLLEAEAMAYNFAVAPRTDRPRVYSHSSWSTHYTLGANCPDFYYCTLFLDGSRTYRLSGRMGEQRLLLMQVYNHLFGHPQSKSIGNYDFHDFELAKDGSFEVIISATPHKGNWMRLDQTSDYNFIHIRRIMADWYDDTGELAIELIDGSKSAYELSEADTARRIDMAAEFLTYTVKQWTIGVYDLCLGNAGGEKNRVFFMSGKEAAAKYGGSPTTGYCSAVFDIQPDEAILIEMEVPDSAYWSFQLGDAWGRALDFMHFQTDINMKRAVIDSDGKFRAVIAIDDPGVPNWLDPTGRLEGFFSLRNYRAITESAPAVRKVKAAAIRSYLPTDTVTVTAEERRKALEYRRRGLIRLYGE